LRCRRPRNTPRLPQRFFLDAFLPYRCFAIPPSIRIRPDSHCAIEHGPFVSQRAGRRSRRPARRAAPASPRAGP
jgi:hypothetical protein